MRVLVAMSGGVDSSVAAALEKEAGHEVVGATMKLWGGTSDSGCCSLADVTDARRVCDHLGIEHHVFNFTAEFDHHVVDAYANSHATGRTPNPCVECNRHLKFDAFLARAARLGFDAIATGHHARVARTGDQVRIARGHDGAKDQSYVLAVLDERARAALHLPIGELTKAEVRERASDLGLRTWAKPDSQDVCFIASRTTGSARHDFLAERIELHPGALVDFTSGEHLGSTDAVELVTVGQRRGLGVANGERRYAIDVDVATRTVRVGEESDLLVDGVDLVGPVVVATPLEAGARVTVQVSAHGRGRAATLIGDRVTYEEPQRRVAPGQLVAWYIGDEVYGSAMAR
jgi:tRNA-uridine 2-sulfurtransferase